MPVNPDKVARLHNAVTNTLRDIYPATTSLIGVFLAFVFGGFFVVMIFQLGFERAVVTEWAPVVAALFGAAAPVAGALYVGARKDRLERDAYAKSLWFDLIALRAVFLGIKHRGGLVSQRALGKVLERWDKQFPIKPSLGTDVMGALYFAQIATDAATLKLDRFVHSDTVTEEDCVATATHAAHRLAEAVNALCRLTGDEELRTDVERFPVAEEAR